MHDFMNGLGDVVSKIIDMVCLSLLWLVSCIPIVTFVPSTAALYYAVVKCVRRDRGHIAGAFFSAFKKNFKQGIVLSAIVTMLGAAILTDIFFAKYLFEPDSGMRYFIVTLFLVVGVIFISWCTVLIPLFSRFSIKLSQLFKYTLFIMVRHYVKTILMTMITIGFILLNIYLGPLTIWFSGSICVLLNSLLMEPLLVQYTESLNVDNQYKPWYLEK